MPTGLTRTGMRGSRGYAGLADPAVREHVQLRASGVVEGVERAQKEGWSDVREGR